MLVVKPPKGMMVLPPCFAVGRLDVSAGYSYVADKQTRGLHSQKKKPTASFYVVIYQFIQVR